MSNDIQLSILPDILSEIASYLDIYSYIRLRSTCRSYHSYLKEPDVHSNITITWDYSVVIEQISNAVVPGSELNSMKNYVKKLRSRGVKTIPFTIIDIEHYIHDMHRDNKNEDSKRSQGVYKRYAVIGDRESIVRDITDKSNIKFNGLGFATYSVDLNGTDRHRALNYIDKLQRKIVIYRCNYLDGMLHGREHNYITRTFANYEHGGLNGYRGIYDIDGYITRVEYFIDNKKTYYEEYNSYMIDIVSLESQYRIRIYPNRVEVNKLSELAVNYLYNGPITTITYPNNVIYKYIDDKLVMKNDNGHVYLYEDSHDYLIMGNVVFKLSKDSKPKIQQETIYNKPIDVYDYDPDNTDDVIVINTYSIDGQLIDRKVYI